jgi:uncharacterized protein (TIGR00266 family)
MQYKIIGNTLPAVICSVDAGETLITEKGAMAWMSPNMEMTTHTGGFKKAFGRMFSGESIFQNRYTAKAGPGQIAFASSFPGKIMAVDVGERDLVCQKAAFLASEATVELSVFFRRKLGAGFFGGEGFIMQRLSGSGTAFIEIDGSLCEYNLAEGEKLIVDTGYVAAMDATCDMDIQTVPGVKNILFGGEGVFNTVITGPGKVYLQTMPLSVIADTIGSVIARD